MPKKAVKTKEEVKEEKKISRIFVIALSLISILGFFSIISENLFEYSIEVFIEPLWLMIMGVAFIIESNPKELFIQIRDNLDEKNFNRITTLVIGAVAFVSGLLTVPMFAVDHFIFNAMKGLVSFVAVLFIIIETWIIKQ
jgi:hypothetical protein